MKKNIQIITLLCVTLCALSCHQSQPPCCAPLNRNPYPPDPVLLLMRFADTSYVQYAIMSPITIAIEGPKTPCGCDPTADIWRPYPAPIFSYDYVLQNLPASPYIPLTDGWYLTRWPLWRICMRSSKMTTIRWDELQDYKPQTGRPTLFENVEVEVYEIGPYNTLPEGELKSKFMAWYDVFDQKYPDGYGEKYNVGYDFWIPQEGMDDTEWLNQLCEAGTAMENQIIQMFTEETIFDLAAHHNEYILNPTSNE